MLHELVYTSSAVPRAMSEGMLDDILAISRERNRRLDISGVLLYENGLFVQLLEGPREAVRELYYGSIAIDTRHKHPLVCWEYELRTRNFAHWCMGFARAGTGAGAGHDAPADGYLHEGIRGLDLSSPASTGRSLLLSIYETMAAHG